MPDLKQFKLPDVGEGLTEAEIVSWKVRPGDEVKINDIIVEIETAKSLVELPSPYAGVIAELMVPEGVTVAVGTVIIAVDTDPSGAAGGASGADDAAVAGKADIPASARTADSETGVERTGVAGTAVTDMVPPIGGPVALAPEVGTPAEGEPVEPGLIGGPAPGGRTSVLVGYGPRETSAKRRPRKVVGDAAAATPSRAAESESQQLQPVTVSVPVAVPADVTVLAKPPVRKLAKDLGVDLLSVPPSGPNGTVTRADVEAAATRVDSVPGPAASYLPALVIDPGAHETRIPIKGVRKLTAQAMVTSAFTAPHVTEFLTVDVTRTVKLVERLKSHRDFTDARLSPLLVLARAMIIAVRRTPEINSTWDESSQEIVQKAYVNLGIAAATPRGLVVPNIKDAGAMSLRQLADALASLVATAREGRTPPQDMQHGTITITNVGVFGIDTGTPIINPGESAILAFGAIREQPWVVRGNIRVRKVTTIALSFDHRVVDGEQGSRFLADVAAILEDPSLALALG